MSCGFGELLFLVESPKQVVQVGSGEAPVERHRGLLIAALEGQQPMGHLAQVGEVVGVQHLALHDREVDLDLVEPGGVDRQGGQGQGGAGAGQGGGRGRGAGGGGGGTRCRLGQRPCSRSTEAGPRWEEPLSTTQNTRSAEAYGAVLITWSTRRRDGRRPGGGPE